MGIPAALLRLSYEGKSIVGVSLRNLNVQAGSSIDVNLRLRGGSLNLPLAQGKQPLEDDPWDPLPGSLGHFPISSEFHWISDTKAPERVDVLEHFVEDTSSGRLVVPLDLESIELLMEKEFSTSVYPPRAFRESLPDQRLYFSYGPAPFGGRGLVAIRPIPRGMVFAYEGRLQRESEANEYTLAVPGKALLGPRPNQVVYIDGTPSGSSLMGGMNEFLWDPSGNQFEFSEYGFVHALRDVRKGEACYVGYGPDYNWDDYKVQLAHELAAAIVDGAIVLGHKDYVNVAIDLMEQVVTWDAEALRSRRSGSALERLFMCVVDNSVPPELTHLVHPTYLGGPKDPEPFGRWLERFLCSRCVIARQAFGKAHDPRKAALELKDAMSVTPAGTRASARGSSSVNYSDDLEFPALPKSSTRAKDVQPVADVMAVVELTILNDPLRGREVPVPAEGLSLDELNGFVYADPSTVERLGDIESSVGEWNLSMLVKRDLEGGATMRAIQSALSDPHSCGRDIIALSSSNLVLQRRVHQQRMLECFPSWKTMVGAAAR